MNTNEMKSNFKMSYAELSGLSKQKANTILRDIEVFERLGISADQIMAFKLRVEEFDTKQIDEEYRGEVTTATQSKNEIAEQVIQHIRELSLIVRKHFGKNSGIYLSLKIKELSTVNDLNLFRKANKVCRILRTLDSEFINPFEPVMVELETLSGNFTQSIEYKEQKVEERDIATHARIEEANSIYNEVSYYCNLGQVIWAERNEAKYNDYLIYGSSKSPDNSPPDNGGEGGIEQPNG